MLIYGIIVVRDSLVQLGERLGDKHVTIVEISTLTSISATRSATLHFFFLRNKKDGKQSARRLYV